MLDKCKNFIHWQWEFGLAADWLTQKHIAISVIQRVEDLRLHWVEVTELVQWWLHHVSQGSYRQRAQIQ